MDIQKLFQPLRELISLNFHRCYKIIVYIKICGFKINLNFYIFSVIKIKNCFLNTLGTHFCKLICTIINYRALQAATGRRGLVFTRSSFVGSGILGGHWTGDNYAYWDHMQYSVIGNFLQLKAEHELNYYYGNKGLLDFNIFGLPYVGADICGFAGDSEERLCERWQELGAFYPFSRNHNAIGLINKFFFKQL